MTEIQKVKANGVLVIPKPMREAAGISDGKYVSTHLNDDNSVTVRLLNIEQVQMQPA